MQERKQPAHDEKKPEPRVKQKKPAAPVRQDRIPAIQIGRRPPPRFQF